MRKKLLSQEIMAYVGKISYSLYPVHGMFGFVVMYWMMGRDIKSLVVIAAIAICLFPITVVFYRLVENNFTNRENRYEF